VGARDFLERELKFAGVELESLRERLTELEAERLRASTLEDNLLFDRDGELRGSGAILRLRKDGHGSRLTFKGPLRLEGTVRVREEREIDVGDAETTRSLLEAMGYGVTRRYQKVREEWQLGGVTIALDHTPIGDFAEFEGEGAESVARRCGLDVSRAERRSYLRLYDDYLEEHPQASADMLFS
jgi:adenylate cyclase class 2